MLKKFYVFMADTRGVTGIEYGLLIGSISLTVATGAFMIGDDFNSIFTSLTAWMEPTPVE